MDEIILTKAQKELEQEAKKDKEAFDKSVDMEFLNLWMDNL